MNLTASILQAGTGCTAAAAVKWLPCIQAACDKYQIATRLRVAAFIAQIGHESGHLVYVREIWGPTAQQRGYDGRADLGNTKPQAISIAKAHGSTPGRWWAGHGLIQVTGFDNHRLMGVALGLDLLNHPEQLEVPANAAMSAGEYWFSRGLNALADASDFLTITRRINGGTNGLADRQALYAAALKAIPA
ncbi:glycoside hydrolase family 19 protein [Aquitalea magnusonii]|uniref:Putative chitinase n=2 Tax=Aquitalea magnusonii TaxID=332411 RepID=A0A318J549_9NEIS|nr:glycoside hydrolase family 19 protein [Aquitalea magnusonii]PXX42780.1 putative chitinase [Aquitalea magnusonii]